MYKDKPFSQIHRPMQSLPSLPPQPIYRKPIARQSHRQQNKKSQFAKDDYRMYQKHPRKRPSFKHLFNKVRVHMQECIEK